MYKKNSARSLLQHHYRFNGPKIIIISVKSYSLEITVKLTEFYVISLITDKI